MEFPQPGKVNSVWSKPVTEQLLKNAAGNVEDSQSSYTWHSKCGPQKMNKEAGGHGVRVDHCIGVDQTYSQTCIWSPRS